MPTILLLLTLSLAVHWPALAIAVEVVIGSTHATACNSATLAVEVRNSEQEDVVGVQNNLLASGPMQFIAIDSRVAQCTRSPDIALGVSSFLFPDKCTNPDGCRNLRALVLSTGLEPFGSSVLYRCRVSIHRGAKPGSYAVKCSDLIATNSRGSRIPALCVDGRVQLLPTTGDCNLDGVVTIDEIVVSVRIALAAAPRKDCPVADRNADGEVTVDEVLTAVSAGLDGCEPPTP